MSNPQTSASGPKRIRQLNRRAVLTQIRNHGPTSRSGLIQSLELSPAAVSTVVSELCRDGLLEETEVTPNNGKLGRPLTLMSLAANAAYALGLVLRPEGDSVKILAAWIDYAGKITLCDDEKIEQADCFDTITKTIINTVQRLENSVPDASRIAAVKIGTPGVVEDNKIAIAPRFPAIQGDQLSSELNDALPYPVWFENDLSLCALSELDQQPRLRTENFAYLYIGSGVGAGVALQGQLWLGRGWAGEIGQLRLSRGKSKRESLEEQLSIDALRDRLAAIGLQDADLDALPEISDRRVKRILEQYSGYLCDAIQVLNAVLDLDEVIVDFPYDRLADHLIERVNTLMHNDALRVTVSTPAAAHGAAIRGAALAAMNQALEKLEQRAT